MYVCYNNLINNISAHKREKNIFLYIEIFIWSEKLKEEQYA